MEKFKNDELEQNIISVCETLFNNIDTEIDSFESGAYQSYKLGEVLWDNSLMPLTNVIKKEIFIYCFNEIFEAWQKCGTFESYISVFQKIFGASSTVSFTVPGPGKLEIDITATEVDEFYAQVREIENEQYVLHDLITQAGDNIIFRSVKGIESEYELNKVLFSLVANGVYTTITLTVA